MRSTCIAAMFLSFAFLCSCADQETTAGLADPGSASTSADILSGTWSGDWGPSETQRNQITVDLSWDGARLTGTLNPGINAVAITTGSFTSDTGHLTMEASGNGADGKTVHYMMDGQLADGVITGTWMDGDANSNFMLKKS